MLYLDPGNLFAREPLSARFIVEHDGRRLPLVVATVHIVYGDSVSERRAEVAALDDYWRWLGATFDGDRLLLGDFNLAPDDDAWRVFDALAQPAITRGATTLSPQNRRYANLYDNIWHDADLPVTHSGIAPYPQWLGITHREARRRVSDHAPVYVVVGNTVVTPPARAAAAVRVTPAVACIDLNTAVTSELDRLAHVGPSRADLIVAGRPWGAVAELERVRGLSARRVADIQANERACVNSEN